MQHAQGVQTMSLINLLISAKAGIAKWRQRRRAFDELLALDDRSLADIGIHRSEIPAIVEGVRTARHEGSTVSVPLPAFSRREAWLTGAHRWLPHY
jgi:uncharacterized protein YjiS (DUF1127 family)